MCLAVVAHAFNPGRGRQTSELDANQIYKVNECVWGESGLCRKTCPKEKKKGGRGEGRGRGRRRKPTK